LDASGLKPTLLVKVLK